MLGRYNLPQDSGCMDVTLLISLYHQSPTANSPEMAKPQTPETAKFCHKIPFLPRP